jgi:tetratricopeptide (TPR) repeat protein
MPQLPSGRHAGIDPAPLFQLFKDAEMGRFVHRLMAITNEAGLLRYLEIVELLPTDANGISQFNPLSVPRPGEFIEKGTGVMADKIDRLGMEWPQGDINAFNHFLSEPRAVELRARLLQKVHERQNHLKTSGEFVARIQAWWWQAGVHPAQEENWAGEEHLADEKEELARQHIAAGGACEHHEDWMGSIKEYRKALVLNPADPRVHYFGHNNLAYSLLKLGKFADAEPHCRAAIEINDGKYNAHLNLGLALEGLGLLADAATSLLNAFHCAPENSRVRLNFHKLLKKHPELLSESPELNEGIAKVRDFYAAHSGEPKLD